MSEARLWRRKREKAISLSSSINVTIYDLQFSPLIFLGHTGPKETLEGKEENHRLSITRIKERDPIT